MEVEIPKIELTQEEELLFYGIHDACLKLREKSSQLKDLDGKFGKEATNFAMICGGWVRDKVVFSNLDPEM